MQELCTFVFLVVLKHMPQPLTVCWCRTEKDYPDFITMT